MPMYDRACKTCEWTKVDSLEPVTVPQILCPEGHETERVWLSSARSTSIIGDEIPGGQWIENLGNTWRKFYSKSEIARAAKEQGLESFVRHVGTQGGDRSKHTTRWI